MDQEKRVLNTIVTMLDLRLDRLTKSINEKVNKQVDESTPELTILRSRREEAELIRQTLWMWGF